jgi:hypothetical protein
MAEMAMLPLGALGLIEGSCIELDMAGWDSGLGGWIRDEIGVDGIEACGSCRAWLAWLLVVE